MYQFLCNLFPEPVKGHRKVRNIAKLSDDSQQYEKSQGQKDKLKRQEKMGNNQSKENLSTVHKSNSTCTQLNTDQQRQFLTGLSHFQVNGLRLKILQLGINGQFMCNSALQIQSQIIQEKCYITICISEKDPNRDENVDRMVHEESQNMDEGHLNHNSKDHDRNSLYCVIFNLQLNGKNQSQINDRKQFQLNGEKQTQKKSNSNNHQDNHNFNNSKLQEINIVYCNRLFPLLEYHIEQFYRNINQNKEKRQNGDEKELEKMVLMSLKSRFDEGNNCLQLLGSIDGYEEAQSYKYRFGSSYSMIGIKLYLLSYLANLIKEYSQLLKCKEKQWKLMKNGNNAIYERDLKESMQRKVPIQFESQQKLNQSSKLECSQEMKCSQSIKWQSRMNSQIMKQSQEMEQHEQQQQQQYQQQQMQQEQQQEQQIQSYSLNFNKELKQELPSNKQQLHFQDKNDSIMMVNQQFRVDDKQQQYQEQPRQQQQQGQFEQSLSQSISIGEQLPIASLQSQQQQSTIFNINQTQFNLRNRNSYAKTQQTLQQQSTFIQSIQNTVSCSMMVEQQSEQNPTSINQEKNNKWNQTSEQTPPKGQLKQKLSLQQQQATTININSYQNYSINTLPQLHHNQYCSRQLSLNQIHPRKLLFQEKPASVFSNINQDNLRKIITKDISFDQDQHITFDQHKLNTLTEPIHYQTQSCQQHQFIILSKHIIIKKLPLQQQSINTQQELDSQLITQRDFHRTTYTLVKSDNKHVICLEILKEQGKLFQKVNQTTANLEQCRQQSQSINQNPLLKQSLEQQQQGQKSKKLQPIRLLLYNPIVLDQKQHIKLSPDYLDRKDLIVARQRLISQLHLVNDFVISSDQRKVLLYSKGQRKERNNMKSRQNVNVVLEYDIQNEWFTNIYEVQSVYSTVRNIMKQENSQTTINENDELLPLKSVLYSPNCTDRFYTLTQKEITLIPTINENGQDINQNGNYYQKQKNCQLLKPKVFLYENCLTLSRDLQRRFDSMCVYQDGEKVVVGMKGRQVKMFDLSKCKPVGPWIGDNVDVRKYRQHRFNKLEKDIQNSMSGNSKRNLMQKQKPQKIKKKMRQTSMKKHKPINKKLTSTSSLYKQSLGRQRNKGNKDCLMLMKNPIPQQLYYLKALNSFNLQQCNEKLNYKERQQGQDKCFKQQIISKRPIIKLVQIIYNNSSKSQIEDHDQAVSKKQPLHIICHRESENIACQNQLQHTSCQIESQHINCQRQQGIMGDKKNEYFKIQCQQLTREGLKVNCFDNKLRISNRSLVKSITQRDIVQVLNEGENLMMV